MHFFFYEVMWQLGKLVNWREWRLPYCAVSAGALVQTQSSSPFLLSEFLTPLPGTCYVYLPGSTATGQGNALTKVSEEGNRPGMGVQIPSLKAGGWCERGQWARRLASQ